MKYIKVNINGILMRVEVIARDFIFEMNIRHLYTIGNYDIYVDDNTDKFYAVWLNDHGFLNKGEVKTYVL